MENCPKTPLQMKTVYASPKTIDRLTVQDLAMKSTLGPIAIKCNSTGEAVRLNHFLFDVTSLDKRYLLVYTIKYVRTYHTRHTRHTNTHFHRYNRLKNILNRT